MAGVGRNIGLAGLLVAVLALAATVLPSATWSCGLATVLALAGVVLFRGNRWRTGSIRSGIGLACNMKTIACGSA